MAVVLIIDDEEVVRDLLREALEFAGHQVAEARNGQEGLQRYRVGPTDLVITDILMPEKNSLEIIEELRHNFPTTKIIALTGSSREFLNRAKQLGAHRGYEKRIGKSKRILSPSPPKRNPENALGLPSITCLRCRQLLPCMPSRPARAPGVRANAATALLHPYLNLLRLLPVGIGSDDSHCCILLIELKQRLRPGPVHEVRRLYHDVRLDGSLAPYECGDEPEVNIVHHSAGEQ
jgi:CheY-like chemotaxis protein